MSGTREKVVVAMSGGVDSSVAACLLVEQGYDVIGFFMRVGNHGGVEPAAPGPMTQVSACSSTAAAAQSESTGQGESLSSPADRGGQPSRAPARQRQGCCSASDASDARFVAGMLGIPFYALNFEEDFDRIIDYFADEYARGRTPNPCVVCNDRLKFGKLLDYADAVGARYIATGHYARIGDCKDSLCRHEEREVETGECKDPLCTPPSTHVPRLLRAVDQRKDQSYVLFGLRPEVLVRTLFPIGHLTKDEVRRIAASHGLPNQNKPDSVEICFAPDRDYARIVQQRRPDGFVPGEVVDATGRSLGRHDGLAHYTVGQRRGLRIAAGKPIYVTSLDVLNNRVVMGESLELESPALIADRVNLLAADLPDAFRAEVKIRYLHTAAAATVHQLGGGSVRVVFDVPQRAITPGQAVVFYDGDVVLGGGWILRAEAASTEIQTPQTFACGV